MGYYLSCSSTVNHISPYQYKGDKAFKATIYRDNMDIPHIFGNTDADAVFGLAYAHAEDDFKTIQDVHIAARGKLSEIYGIKLFQKLNQKHAMVQKQANGVQEKLKQLLKDIKMPEVVIKMINILLILCIDGQNKIGELNQD